MAGQTRAETCSDMSGLVEACWNMPGPCLEAFERVQTCLNCTPGEATWPFVFVCVCTRLRGLSTVSLSRGYDVVLPTELCTLLRDVCSYMFTVCEPLLLLRLA